MLLFGKPLELLILDVDGVIVDVINHIRPAMIATAKRIGLSLEPLSEFWRSETNRSRFCSGLQNQIRACWPHLDNQAVLDYCWRFQEERRRNPWRAISGSIEAINWFRENNILLALCTTNDRPTLINQLKTIDIDPAWFVAMSTWESGHPKPDPRAIEVILKNTNVSRSHSAYIGDWYPDLIAARGAEIRFIAALSGGMPREMFLNEGVPTDHIIERLSEFPKLLKKLVLRDRK